ncbi:MAG: hypothetical protein M3Y41_14385 [Pseudomonadota bacterium]|nr:hypothetical protein [Pseudomonadota bacterium]
MATGTRAGQARTGQKAAKSEVEVVEQGDVDFVFRPKVDQPDPAGLEDVERFFVVLRPRTPRVWRLLVIGRKRLPEIDAHERNWGFVDLVTRSVTDVRKALAAATYETKTRGERRLPAARPAGEGTYALIRQRPTLHLVYRLELPEQPGPVQTALGIERQGNFVLSLKNPAKPAPSGVGLNEKRKPKLRRDAKAAFRGRRFETEEAAPLQFERAEFILIGARQETRIGDHDAPEPQDEDAESSDLLALLRGGRIATPTEPLLEGDWR